MIPLLERTGIEIHVGPPPSDRVVAAADVVIIVDGARRVAPLYGEHFVDVGPGVHEVEMFVQGRAPSSDNVLRALRSRRLRVHVTAGRTTVLRYTPTDGPGATLALATSAPA